MATACTATLKLLVDTKSQKVLFAEASKDFVDFLFSITLLPAGVLVGLTHVSNNNGNLGHCTLTCLNNLHTCLQNFDPDYLLRSDHQYKFKPFMTCVNTSSLFLLHYIASPSTYKAVFKCSKCNISFLKKDIPNVLYCSKCMSSTNPVTSRDHIVSSCEEGGYVKGVVKYMVTDDLTVKPVSAVSSFNYLKTTLDIKNFALIEEIQISFGQDQVMEFVKVMLQSNTVLTDMFLRNVDKK